MQPSVDADSVHEVPIGGSISGIVRVAGERGLPIAGARVCVWALADDEGISNPLSAHCTLTEPDGHYRLEGLAGGRQRLTASAAKHIPSTWRDARHAHEWLILGADEQRSGVDLTLLPGGLRLAGVVEDVAGGAVPDALIVASTMRVAGGPVATALGDDDGRFEIWVAPNQYVLRAVASGYAEAGAVVQAPNEAITIRLVPESVLVGHVIDAASNEPLAGVEVGVGAGDRRSTVSGDDGAFRIAGLRPGRYQPEASGEGVFGRLPRAVVLGLGQTSEPIELLVYPAVRLSGQLVARSLDGSERGCAEGRVFVRGSMLAREASADGDGQIRIEGLPAGRYQIEPSCPGFFAHDRVELLLDADLDDQRWLFESGLEIAGIAVDGSGRPLPGLYVDAQGTGMDAGGSISRTDADGQFVLGPLRPDSYGVWLRIDAEAPDRHVEVELRDRSVDDVRLVAGEFGTIQVSVRDAEDNGVPSKHVSVQTTGARSLGQAFTDGEGNVSFTGLPVGPAYVARTQDMQPGEHKPRGVRVEILSGEVTTVELRGESTFGSITGIVTEAGGPAGEAWVVAGHGGEDDETSPVLCEPDGRFTLTNLAAGTYSVRAYREGGGQAVARDVVVGESVRLELEAPTSLFGHVRFADGTTPEHFLVELIPTDAGRPIELSFYRSEGRFEFESLAAGRYTVEVDAGSGQANEKIELEAGERGELEFVLDRRVTVMGRLVDAHTKAGVSALTVHVQPRGRPAKQIVQPDREGRFVLTNVPVGTVQLGMTPKSWESPAYPLQLTWIITTDSPTEQDIGDVLVVGRRRAGGGSKGDVGFDYEFDGRFDAEQYSKVRVRVSTVDRGGPADAAGLRVGDVITAVDGVSVQGGGAKLMRLLVNVAAGATLQLDRADGGRVSIVAR